MLDVRPALSIRPMSLHAPILRNGYMVGFDDELVVRSLLSPCGGWVQTLPSGDQTETFGRPIDQALKLPVAGSYDRAVASCDDHIALVTRTAFHGAPPRGCRDARPPRHVSRRRLPAPRTAIRSLTGLAVDQARMKEK